jgi:hypothetical protein
MQFNVLDIISLNKVKIMPVAKGYQSLSNSETTVDKKCAAT